MRLFGKSGRARLMFSAAAGALTLGSGAAWAQDGAPINVAPQSLTSALYDYGRQVDRQVMFTPGIAASKTTAGVSGVTDEGTALAQLLAGTGLTYRTEGDVFVIVQAGEGGSSPQDQSAAGGGAEVEALIVTAQKREEAIQDVPIAISAFSQRDLEEQKIEGGYDLLKAIPNVTFSKSNFSSYNFSIRGVGTKAISATTDPGVAVAFNNTTLVQNRLFEQEYFDIERVEVLRGPQGTLYGRNATSGVINVITAKPDLNDLKGSLKGEIGNYDARRVVGMLNVPLIEDVLAVRVAGAMTQRSGYDYNEVTASNVNGRDLWSSRVTVGFEPMPSLRANLVWEHFEEDDDRSRTSKQLCHHDGGRDVVGSTVVLPPGMTSIGDTHLLRPHVFSQGCKAGSLYDDAAFGTPDGLALPFIFAIHSGIGNVGLVGRDPGGVERTILNEVVDPYGGLTQSRDLRTISSFNNPIYSAKADLLDLTIDFDLSDALTLTSQTVYNEDQVFSFQDYNRFNTLPIFTDTTGFTNSFGFGPYPFSDLAPGGVFCDPQVGCSDTLAGFDISQADGKQFSQELRLSSDMDGPLNFSLGANYTRFKTLVDYYVFYNIISAMAQTGILNTTGDPTRCHGNTFIISLPIDIPITDPTASCPLVDMDPITEGFDGDGHNYFRSKNPYKLKSAAAFGEVYWNIADDLKLTAGLRYTQDEKTFIPVPSQILLAPGNTGGGTVNKGYPELDPIVQEWGEWTGRLGLDWKPALPFTDETMVYGFYSRGYKGGGANPPSPGFATADDVIEQTGGAFDEPVLFLTSVEYGRTFEPEFVDAFEVGSKNTLLSGAMTFNATGFFYDYKDYQVSQIRDRTAVNENFDATIWGLEFETVFAPNRDLRFNANLGYLDTKIADGESSIDIMNRTQSDPDYIVFKPWMQLPSNCVVPVQVAEEWLAQSASAGGVQYYFNVCGGLGSHIVKLFDLPIIDRNPAVNGGTQPYDVGSYPELNGGAGLRADLGGNELPNAPHWTANIGGQYGRDVLGGAWRVTLRGDAYWQSQSWARVYNAVNDKLHGWYNLNVSVRVANEDLGIEGEFYVKNLLDKSPITDAFLNSDDSGLTTNVFVLDPRLVGFSLRKTF